MIANGTGRWEKPPSRCRPSIKESNLGPLKASSSQGTPPCRAQAVGGAPPRSGGSVPFSSSVDQALDTSDADAILDGEVLLLGTGGE